MTDEKQDLIEEEFPETETIIDEPNILDIYPDLPRYMSSRGIWAVFSPMPMLLRTRIAETMKKEGLEEPQPPTYEVEQFGGEIELHEHDESTIETEEDQEVWQKFLDDTDVWSADFSERLAEAVKVLCMEVPGMDEDNWVEKFEYLDIEVPDKKKTIDRKKFYIDNVFIGSREDVIAIIQIPLFLTLEQPTIQGAAARLFRQATVEGSGSAGEAEADSTQARLDLA